MTTTPLPGQLTGRECWDLIRDGGVGRVALTTGALPTIVPVRYETDGDRLLMCLGERVDLAPSIDNAVVAFEADSLGDETGYGWFVQARGVATLAASSDLSMVCPHGKLLLVAELSRVAISGLRFHLCDRPAGLSLHNR